MKRIFYIWVLCCRFLALASCSSEDNSKSLLPDIYMEKVRSSLAVGSLEVKILVDEPVKSTITVPFTFAGEAVEGTDFTASAHEFVFQPGTKEAVITLNRQENNVGDEDKDLLINLDRKAVPQGYRFGLMNFTTITLMSKNGIVMSFDNDKDILTLKSQYPISLSRVKGGTYRVPEATNFEVEVDPSSTAVEGEHFEFPHGAFVSVPKNKNTGFIAVNWLKQEAGKDKLVLRLKEKSGYAYGNHSTLELTVKGPYVLTGTWAFQGISNKDWWESSWGEDTSTFPTGTADDQITFEGGSYKGYTFIPLLKGDLKNYFVEGGTVTWQDEVYKDYQEDATAMRVQHAVEVFSFEHINVNFSATHRKLRPAVVSFRIIQEEDKDILECTIDDFEPTDFLAATYDIMKDYGENPVMLSCPLRLRFTRVK